MKNHGIPTGFCPAEGSESAEKRVLTGPAGLRMDSEKRISIFILSILFILSVFFGCGWPRYVFALKCLPQFGNQDYFEVGSHSHRPICLNHL
ncbi:MAG: hypothetical protein ABSH38_20310 [Verrucomicrobiota bacterium]